MRYIKTMKLDYIFLAEFFVQASLTNLPFGGGYLVELEQ